MANEQNLKPYKKGESGNPAGKPKGAVNLTTKMREALDRIHEGSQTQYDDILIQSILRDAIKTDGQSRKLVMQYMEGMPKQSTEISVLPSKISDSLQETIDRIYGETDK